MRFAPATRLAVVLLAVFLVLIPARTLSAGTVAVLLSVKIPEYDDALDGFRQNIGDHQIVGIFNLNGKVDQGPRILQQINEKNPDVILAVGLWALQAVLQDPPAKPVIYTMVPNPGSIVPAGAGNITGASVNVPPAYTFTLVTQIKPGARRIGVIYNPAATGTFVEEGRVAAHQLGLELIAVPAQHPKAALHALMGLKNQQVDALWVVPDPVVLGEKVFNEMLLFSYRQKVPLVGLSDRHASKGAVLALSFGSSHDVGAQSAELASQVLAGKPPQQVPPTSARNVKIFLNLIAAEKLDIDIPAQLQEQANIVTR